MTDKKPTNASTTRSFGHSFERVECSNSARIPIVATMILVGFVAICFVLACQPKEVKDRVEIPNHEKSDSADTSLCDLATAPDKFFDIPVRLRAGMRYGFEVLELYSLRCVDPKKSRLRVELPKSDDNGADRLCENSGKVDKIDYPLMSYRTFGVVVRGTLVRDPNPTYATDAHYKFRVNCYETVEVIDSIPSPQNPENRKKMEQFESNK